MKKTLLVIVGMIALSGSAARAGSPDVVASVENVNEKVARVELTKDGVLSVELRQDHSVVRHQLSAEVANDVITAAQRLATVELMTVHHQAVCMIYLPYQPTLMVGNADGSGTLKEVLSPQGCWLKETIAPKDKMDYDEATRLETQLLTISQDVVPATRSIISYDAQ
jgi:hypothetical protein